MRNEDDNDDGSGGGRDDDNYNDNDNEPQIPEDVPATTSALTAKKIECPEGQEAALFSTTCGPAGTGADSTTSAATMCPTSPTPTSYGIQDQTSILNTIWGLLIIIK